jgi:23S rRNA (cytosine1962-C5)-methyltransferase
MSSLENTLELALAARRALRFPSPETTCYRLVHGAADGIEGLTVDVYDGWLVASLYTDERGAREERWLDALAELGFRGVYLKHRPKQANELAADERRERCPPHAVRGESAPDVLVVKESGIAYEVRLGDGLSTGLFLDQRDNRARLRGSANDKTVLNLFSYTCAFGVAAAVGGARATTNMDVAKPVLERGRRNYELAGLELASHTFLARDVLDALPRLARKPDRFDVVVLDPPSYASAKGRRFSVERDYAELAALASALVADRGRLLACTNHHRLDARDLERALRDGAERAGRLAKRAEQVPPPPDFPDLPGRPSHLKSVWLTF